MKNFIRLGDYSKSEIFEIFKLANSIGEGQYKNYLKDKTILLFFPSSSIRTRVTFEKGIHMLGGQSILFPSDALNKDEKIEDVIGYLNNWVDCVIVRHNEIKIIDEMARHSKVPIINAMTNINHPCEILSDLYGLSKLREDYLKAKYLFVGGKGNIGLAWEEASRVLGFSLEQSCPKGYEIENLKVEYDISKAIIDKDIILTDPIGKENLDDFKEHQVSKKLMNTANKGAILNPCPPFFRGQEVSEDVINSKYFVGYEFKKSLLEVQQAIIIYCMNNNE